MRLEGAVRLLVAATCGLLVSGLGAAPAPDLEQTGESDRWAVRLRPGASPEAVAQAVGAANWRKVGSLPDAVVLEFREETEPREAGLERRAEFLAAHPSIFWEERQTGRLRYLRGDPTAEPGFADQWHLLNEGQWGGLPGVDVNVVDLWAEGLTGAGVGVSVVDTGTDYNHPDLSPNYVKGRDQWDDDTSALPVNADENHGTAVAGIILAAANGRDGTGIAPAAGLYPMRLLRNGGSIPDSDEAEALGIFPDEVFISNNSWGPSDESGVSLAEIGSLVKATFENAEAARGGKGTIYVWAAGNGRDLQQRADYDGYNAARQTIAVAAIGQDGQVTDYSEPGACVFISAPSRFAGRGIFTTDRPGSTGYAPGNTTADFSGTSAAAPMVSGVVALLLEANPGLGWRDVQHVLARTAVRTDWDDEGWFMNAAGFPLHEDYGFGRIDARGAVELARRWTNRPPATLATASNPVSLAIGDRQTVSRQIQVNSDMTVEHVELDLNLQHTAWRQLEITLVSPSGTRSVLSRPFATQNSSFDTYRFMSVQFWGERTAGNWRVEIEDTVTGATGSLNSVTLRLHGVSASPAAAPVQRESILRADRWPLALEAPDWLDAPAGSTLDILSAVALERGRAWRDVGGQWWFEPPEDGFGAFPLALTVATPAGEARSFVVTIDRPSLATDGVTAASLFGLGTTANLQRAPRYGSIADAGAGVTYLPGSEQESRRGADRFALGPVGRFDAVSVPVLYGNDWVARTNGRDDAIILELASRSLDQRFTVEGWFKAETWGEALTGFGRLFDKESFLFFLNGYGHSFYPDACLVVYAEFTGGLTAAYTTPARSFPLGEWVHVGVTFDAQRSPQVQVFFNGERMTTSSPSSLEPPPSGTALASNAGSDAYLGDNQAGARGFNGAFRDLRIWSALRTQAQLQAAFGGAAPDAPASLLARFNPSRPGLEEMVLEGALAPTARFRGVSWEAAVSPWQALRDAFPRATDVGSGWWDDPTLGPLFGDRMPWVFLEDLGWLWTAPNGADPSVWFYRHAGGHGWLHWTENSHPWIYDHGRGAWLYHLAGTKRFFDAQLGEWILIE